MLLKAVLILVVILGGFWYFSQPKQAPLSSPKSFKTDSTYEDSKLKFSFRYPEDFEAVFESEEEYSKRTKTQYRKNFKYYVTYEPPKFVKGVLVKPKNADLTEDQFQAVPFMLWVFENPEKTEAQKWYKDFWYYPFFWGVYDIRKSQIEPSLDATISGQLTKSAIVSYSPGKPKLILIPKDGRMFLFKIMEGGDKIIESFKFN
ncbi:MAG: hypothetical protein AAB414_00285 [Patescibacteria group bacterium]